MGDDTLQAGIGRIGSARMASERRPVVLFGIAHAGFLRNCESVIGRLCDAGVDVRVHCSKPHESITLDDYELERRSPGTLEIAIADGAGTSSSRWAARARVARDILHYSGRRYEHADDLRRRFSELQKSEVIADRWLEWFRRLCARDAPRIKAIADTFFAWVDGRIPPNDVSVRLIDDVRPDLVIVTPLVNFASREVDLVKAARRRGIPTLLAVASWDNLTNKGLLKIQPDHVAVWNHAMAREAEELHHVHPGHIWITGAPLFDQWFTRTPSRDRTMFCRALGLKPKRPLVVYLCSSLAIAGTDEYQIVKAWIAAIHKSDDALLARASILVRPHPMALRGWVKMLPQPTPRIAWRHAAAIWPTQPTHATTAESRADFFDTLYHADALVALNTSAMIEAAILRKPVLTFLGHDKVASQTGNLHFQHLEDGGFVSVARDLAEHERQLASVLHDPGSVGPACKRFVRQFVQPDGDKVPPSAMLARRILDLVGKGATVA